jgi:peptide/nickel transport system permease protein
MGLFILRRLGIMILTALCLTFIVFSLTNLYPNLEKLAKTQGNFRMSDEAVTSYLDNRGYTQALPIKYGQWLGVLPGYVIDGSDGETRAKCAASRAPTEDTRTFCGILQGEWGQSTVFKEDVTVIVATRSPER